MGRVVSRGGHRPLVEGTLMPSPWVQRMVREHIEQGSPLDWDCACGHAVRSHDRPPAEREPWGGCNQIDPTTSQRCACREAWPVDPEDQR